MKNLKHSYRKKNREEKKREKSSPLQRELCQFLFMSNKIFVRVKKEKN